MTAIVRPAKASALELAGIKPALTEELILSRNLASMRRRIAASSSFTSFAASEQLMAELANRQPAGVSVPVNPCADACRRSRAASRALGASEMMDSEVTGPDR